MSVLRKKLKTKDSLVEIKPKKALIGVNETSTVVLALIGLTGTIALCLMAIMLLLVNNHKLAGKKTIFVQQTDGTVQKASEKNPNFRSDEVINRTVSYWLGLTWEWDNRIANSNETDKGITIGTGAEKFVVPSKVYTASFLVESGFRTEFLRQMSEIIPKEVYTGDVKSKFSIYHLSEPLQKGDTYEVNVVASRIDFSDRGEKRQVDFNKTIVLKPVEPYQSVLGEDEPSAFRKHLSQLMKNGLMITSIRNYE